VDDCDPVVKDVVGKIGLIGVVSICSEEFAVRNVVDGGAVGAIVIQDIAGNFPWYIAADDLVEDPTIGSMSVAKALGDQLLLLAEDAPIVNLTRTTVTQRDGALDNGLMTHEYGHYIHRRLVEGFTDAVNSKSEGWADFLAVLTSLREGDDLDGVYQVAPYATWDPYAYFGLRRVPYSVDMAHNALSFRHISDGVALPDSHPMRVMYWLDNSQYHSAGEVWATMLWEAYISLHKAKQGELTFAEIERRMADYVIAGMILAPPSPTHTEQRDAILAAAYAGDPTDFAALASGFATRGAGTCAVSPPRKSTDFIGVVEDFELRANARMGMATASDSLVSCDDDGVIDEGEVGEVTVSIHNKGAVTLPAGASLEVISASPKLVFPNGPILSLPELAAQEEFAAALAVELQANVSGHDLVMLTFRLTGADGCEPFTDIDVPLYIDSDIAPESATIDSFDTTTSVWSPTGDASDSIWSRRFAGDGYHWHGDDIGYISDTALESPELIVSQDEAFTVSLAHAYDFEAEYDSIGDGGVIEVSKDSGETWEDVSVYVDPGYTGVIEGFHNPLLDQAAFVGLSPAFPEAEDLLLDFGLALAGESVKLRFRIATDGYVRGYGWDLDDVAFEGIEGTPFPAWVDDQTQCEDGSETDTDTGSETETPTETDATNTDTDTDADSDTTGSTDGTDSNGDTTSGTETGRPITETDTTAGTSETDGTDSDSSGEVSEGGCGCDVEGHNPPFGLLVLGLLGLVRRRKTA